MEFNDRYFDDFLARVEGAPYAEQRGEVSAFYPMFGMAIIPGAVRSEEMWLTSVENGAALPDTDLDVLTGCARTAHNLDCIRTDRVHLLNSPAV